MTVHHAAAPIDAPDVDAAMSALRESGLRISAARRLTLEALYTADGPVSAEQIADGLGGRLTRSDIGGVYRNLERFERAGLVRHFHLGHGPGLYVLAAAEEREYLVCDSCGEFRSLDPGALDGARALIEREFGYRAGFTHFPVVGLCPECASRAGQDAA